MLDKGLLLNEEKVWFTLISRMRRNEKGLDFLMTIYFDHELTDLDYVSIAFFNLSLKKSDKSIQSRITNQN